MGLRNGVCSFVVCVRERERERERERQTETSRQTDIHKDEDIISEVRSQPRSLS